MYSQIIGTQQIAVTGAFLAVMIIVLVVLRRKGGAIRASLKAGKRIAVVEDTAVSPTERLRLISIDNSEFIMLSAKGQPPLLVPFVKDSTATPNKSGTPAGSTGLADIAAPEVSAEKNSKAKAADDTLYPSPAERAAFIEKFQSWRRDHAAR
jgi:hypothetical protein